LFTFAVVGNLIATFHDFFEARLILMNPFLLGIKEKEWKFVGKLFFINYWSENQAEYWSLKPNVASKIKDFWVIAMWNSFSTFLQQKRLKYREARLQILFALRTAYS
jgi:hypothetical protein